MPASCVPACEPHPSTGARIFVFGCARSGTTLLLNLFHTFSGVEVWDGENCFNELIASPSAGTVVAKRAPTCADHLVEDARRFRKVWIIDILRDPRDVVTSELSGEFYCDFARWRRDVLTAQQLAGWHVRLLRLRYEHLVSDPDDVQTALSGALGLQPVRSFRAFIDAVPAGLSEVARQTLGGLRPIEACRVDRWKIDARQRGRVKAQLEEHPDMEATLRWVGYPPTPKALSPSEHVPPR
jgi:hypothetical protein